jgi:hypothetical protein
MDLQLLAKRRFYALTAALIITLLFLKFHTLSNLNSGISASGNHQRLLTSGPLRDIYNATLGVSLNLYCRSTRMMMTRDPNRLHSSKRYSSSAYHPGRTVAMACHYKLLLAICN